jgi:release factor glutamine methyltransferase
VETNSVLGKVDVRLGDLFGPILKTEKFDLIVFNAPYLPSEPSEEKTWIERAWAGGHKGRQIIDKFIDEAPQYLKENGRILLAQSTLSNIEKTITKFSRASLEAVVVAEKKFPFETIVVVEAKAFISRKQQRMSLVKRL